LNRLSPAARAHLQVAAVIGTVVPLDLWCAACDAELDELNNSWIEARAAQIVVERASGTGFEFRHALLREALYASIPVPRRQGLHQRLAEALSARRTPDPDAMSYHLQQAGDDAFVRWLVRAGGRAERSYAWREAFDRFSTAAAELDDRPDRRLERGWLLFRLGAMLRFSDVRRALRYFEQATDVADVLGDQVLWAFATYARGSQRVQTGDFRGGLPILERGIRALIAMPLHDRRRLNATTGVFNADAMPDFDTLSAHGRRDDPEPADPGLVFPGDLDRQGVLALMLARVGDARRALAVTDEAIAQLATGEPSRTFHIGHLQRARGLALALLGLPDESIHWLQESIRTFDSGPAYMQQLDSIATTLRALVLPYRLEDARLWFELTSNAHQIGALAQDAFPKGLSYHHLLLAVYLADGEWDKADELVQSAQLATGQVVMRHGIQTAGAELALARGNTQAAWGYVRSVLEGGPTTEPGDSMYLASMRLIRVAVELSLADGHLADARAWLECHDRWLEWSGAVPGRAEGQLAWAAWQRAAGDAGAERACIERAVILASAPRQPLELLHAHLALGEWHLRARDPSEAARQLDSAADLAERCDMPVERHHIRLVRAEVALAEGRLDDAQRLLDDVRPFCERLQVAALLRRAADLEQSIAARRTRRLYPANLSEREVEVLRLVAGGMTDAEVADTLSISPRTVGQHLRSIYNKLGVSSRVAAARFAIAHDLV
jgi:DNA-binding CsgD family transcriptional regulator